jgi:two-component system NtrC family sensor kinase
MDGAVEAVRTEPSGRNLALARDAEQGLIANLNDIMAALQRRTDALAEGYERQQHLIQLTAIGTSLVGAAASAAVILVFFTRLARDIERLRARAAAIVSGYAGEPLRNHRNDEVGALIEVVNHMQVDLRHWERQQEISRQQRFHQEKMAAVGSMAAAIGHEVSNPMAAIAGMAQFLIDESRDDGHKLSQLAHDFGMQILRQTERISLIMRQLATLTRAHSPEPELLDLNALVHSTCNFIAYDKRFRGIEFVQDLDHELPALFGVTDHLTQVLMNLLINAADAMEGFVAGNGGARIRITTRVEGLEVRLSVADSGHGMTPEVQARAFEESFTTKPAGKGRGIGLYLCKTLIEQARGRIVLTSLPNAGTTVSLFLPLSRTDGAGG